MASFDNSLIDQVCAMTDAQCDPEELDTILHELQSRTATEPAATITTSDVPEREICAAYFDPDMIRVLTEAIGDQCEEVKNSPSNDESEVTDSDSSAFGNEPTSAVSNVWSEQIGDNLFQELFEVPAEGESMDISSPANECRETVPAIPVSTVINEVNCDSTDVNLAAYDEEMFGLMTAEILALIPPTDCEAEQQQAQQQEKQQQQQAQQQEKQQQQQPKQQQQEQPQKLQIFQDILRIDEGLMHNQHTDSLRVHKKMRRHHERLSSGADQTYRTDRVHRTQAFYTSSLEFLEPFKKLELVQTLQRTINRSVACINTAVTDSCLRKGHMFMIALARKILDENAAICTPPLMTLSSSRFINSIRIVTDGCIDKKNLPRVTRIEAYR